PHRGQPVEVTLLDGGVQLAVELGDRLDVDVARHEPAPISASRQAAATLTASRLAGTSWTRTAHTPCAAASAETAALAWSRAVTAPVHDHVRDTGRGDEARHVGIGEPAADVVDQDRPRGHGGLRHPDPHGVDAHGDARPGQLGDHGENPAQLLVLRYPLGARP